MTECNFDLPTLAWAKAMFDTENRFSIIIGKVPTGQNQDIKDKVIDFYFDNDIDNWISIIDNKEDEEIRTVTFEEYIKIKEKYK